MFLKTSRKIIYVFNKKIKLRIKPMIKPLFIYFDRNDIFFYTLDLNCFQFQKFIYSFYIF